MFWSEVWFAAIILLIDNFYELDMSGSFAIVGFVKYIFVCYSYIIRLEISGWAFDFEDSKLKVYKCKYLIFCLDDNIIIFKEGVFILLNIKSYAWVIAKILKSFNLYSSEYKLTNGCKVV